MGRAVVLSSAFLIALAACGGPGGANRSTSPLDVSFNGQGWITSDGTAGAGVDDAALGVATDAAGRIVVTGYSRNILGDDDMAIWRIDDAGGLDETFNGQGWTVHDGAAGGSGDDSGYGIAIDPRGRIVIGGSSRAPGPERVDMTAWRFADGGVPDGAFNGRGWVTHHGAAGGDKEDIARGIAIDPSGRILVVGWSRRSGGNDDMVIWRYDDGGVLDVDFNGQGWVTHDSAAGGNKRDRGLAIVLDGAGRILVTGHSRAPGGNVDMVIWRYNDDGSLDPTFAGRGWVLHDSAAGGLDRDEGRALALDPLGRIVAAGSSISPAGDTDMVIWRFDEDGLLDPTLGGRGWIVHDDAAGGGGADEGNAVALDGSGRILVAGSSVNAAGNPDMAIWRFEADGSPDVTFNEQGWFVHDGAAGGSGEDLGLAITLDSRGRILVAGSSLTPDGSREMVVWRLLERGSGAPPAP